MKFFPIYEGGVLVSSRHALDGVALRSAGAAFEAKIALNSLERGFDYGRLPAVRAALWLPRALAMLRLASPSRIAALRRANWLRLHQALRGLPGMHPMFDTLPDGVCPWVYPLLADDAPRLSARLRSRPKSSCPKESLRAHTPRSGTAPISHWRWII